MAGARESISPLIRNVQSRRLSLELCQKVGNHLLSPSRSNDKCDFPTSSNSQSKNLSPSQLSRIQQNSALFQLSSEAGPLTPKSGYRRGSSGCISPLAASFNAFSDDINNNNNQILEASPTSINNRRRSSLTPIYPSASSSSGIPGNKSSTIEAPSSYLIPTINVSSPEHQRLQNLYNKTVNENRNLDDETLESLVAQKCNNLTINPNEVLGKGSFGTVVSGIYHGQQVAVKIIHTSTTNREASLKAEENAFQILKPHPHIARIYEIIQIGHEQSLIVMERLQNGSLLTTLNDLRIQLTDTICFRLAIEIASALYYCHSNGILHLDVKPSNILMDFQNHCKLSDFGNSKTTLDLMYGQKFVKLDGTVAYIAPECFRGVIPTDKCDVYSFGVTMWQILSREAPYQGETEHSIIYKVVAQNLRPGNRFMQYFGMTLSSEESLRKYINLYEHCWEQCPEHRPNMKIVNEQLLPLQK